MANTDEVVKKFFVASLFMWILPLAVLYSFNHNWFPGFTEMSIYSQTLLSGFIAVLSVNMVIAYYIYMALREPSDKHEPDPAFVAKAKTSLDQFKSVAVGPSSTSSSSHLSHGKEE